MYLSTSYSRGVVTCSVDAGGGETITVRFLMGGKLGAQYSVCEYGLSPRRHRRSTSLQAVCDRVENWAADRINPLEASLVRAAFHDVMERSVEDVKAFVVRHGSLHGKEVEAQVQKLVTDKSGEVL